MSNESKNLPWLDRLHMYIPGHAGYQQPGARESSDRVFREALGHRLDQARNHIARAIQQCIDHHAEREVGGLQAIDAELVNLAARVQRTAGPGAFPLSGAIGDAKADAFHALDHALLDQAEALVTMTHRAPEGHDWLAEIKAAADSFGRKLDARAMLFEHLS